MKIPEMMALAAGRELDNAVAEIVFSNTSGKKVARYSTSGAAFEILTHTEMPLAVGRVSKADLGYEPTKPFYCQDMTPITVKGQRSQRVIAATPEVALCKMACLYAMERMPAPSPTAPNEPDATAKA